MGGPDWRTPFSRHAHSSSLDRLSHGPGRYSLLLGHLAQNLHPATLFLLSSHNILIIQPILSSQEKPFSRVPRSSAPRLWFARLRKLRSSPSGTFERALDLRSKRHRIARRTTPQSYTGDKVPFGTGQRDAYICDKSPDLASILLCSPVGGPLLKPLGDSNWALLRNSEHYVMKTSI